MPSTEDARLQPPTGGLLSHLSFDGDRPLGPTLVSAILHMIAIILLALFTLKGVEQASFELSILPSEQLAEEQIEQLELAAFESVDVAAPQVTVEFEPIMPMADIEALVATNDVSLAPSVDTGFMDLAGGGGGLARGSGKAHTSVFGLAAEGSKFVYLFDRSKSMISTFRNYEGGVLVREVTPLLLAKAEMLRSLEPLSPSDQFQIVFYNQQPLLFDDGTDLRRLIPASPERKAQAQQFVTDVPGKGSTNHVSAMQLGLNLKPDVIFLITDGEAKDDPPKRRVRSLIRKCQKQGVQVHIVHFSTQVRPDCTLLPLAEETGGVHRFINLNTMTGP